MRHIAASKSCFTVKLGFWEIEVEALAAALVGDVMARRSGGRRGAGVGRTTPASR